MFGHLNKRRKYFKSRMLLYLGIFSINLKMKVFLTNKMKKKNKKMEETHCVFKITRLTIRKKRLSIKDFTMFLKMVKSKNY